MCELTGQYEFCFNVPGTYFYWSGDVNTPYNTIYLRGQVTVTQRQSSLVDLKVKVGGVEAEHDTGTIDYVFLLHSSYTAFVDEYHCGHQNTFQVSYKNV